MSSIEKLFCKSSITKKEQKFNTLIGNVNQKTGKIVKRIEQVEGKPFNINNDEFFVYETDNDNKKLKKQVNNYNKMPNNLVQTVPPRLKAMVLH